MESQSPTQAASLQAYARNITSQFGEDGILAEIFRRIGARSRICVEFGAWDGRFLSNTWDLWRNQGWRAVLIEGDEARYRSLEESVRRHSAVRAVHAFITPHGENCLDQVLKRQGIAGEIDLLSVDIDGDEYYVFESIRQVRPRVVVVEYNPTIPPEMSLVQKQGAYFGASARALVDLAQRKNYSLACCTQTNCIFVEKADFEMLGISEPALEQVFQRHNLTYVVNAYDGATFATRAPLFSREYQELGRDALATKLIHSFKVGNRSEFSEPPAEGLISIQIHLLGRLSRGRSLWRMAAAWVWRRTSRILGIDRVQRAHLERARERSERETLQAWVRNGRPVPPPHQIKQQVVCEFAERRGIKVLVETGTYLGDMVEAMRSTFESIYSIELSPELFKRAVDRFAIYENVHIVYGDSAIMLRDVLEEISEPAIFWLDGHYSAGNTAKGDKETPVLSEVEHILRHSVRSHVILVDDARCFDGTADYPTIAELEAYVRERRPGASFEVRDDIIRIA